MKFRSLLTMAAAFALVASSAGIAAAGPTLTVDGDGQEGWLFNRDAGTATPYEFSLDEASVGSGSLYVLPIANDPTGSDKFIAEQFIGVDMGTVDSIAYDFLIAGDGTGADANEFYLNLYVNHPDSSPDKYYDCRYDYVPTTGSTTGFTTAHFAMDDAPSSMTTSGSAPAGFTCPATPSEMPGGSYLRMFSLSVGDTSDNDTGLAGYYDNVSITRDGDVTTWDFEVPVRVKDDCRNGGYVDFGFANQGECISALQANDNADKE